MALVSPLRLARFRSHAYKLLATAFLFPDLSRLARLTGAARRWRDCDFLSGLALYDPWMSLLRTLRGVSPQELGTLQVEYTHLFAVAGVGGCPPYESHFTSPRPHHGAHVIADIERQYATEGVTVDPGLGEPADHAAVELEFMGVLCAKEAAGWADRAYAACAPVLGRELQFLSGHLGRWFPSFAGTAANSATHPYAAVIQTTDALVHHDQDFVELLLQCIPESALAATAQGGPH